MARPASPKRRATTPGSTPMDAAVAAPTANGCTATARSATATRPDSLMTSEGVGPPGSTPFLLQALPVRDRDFLASAARGRRMANKYAAEKIFWELVEDYADWANECSLNA